MAREFSIERVETTKADTIIVACVIVLAGMGLATLFSASYDYALRFFNNPYYFLIRQGLALLVSVVALLICARVDLALVQKKIPLILAVTFGLSLLPFLPVIGMEKNGAARWFRIGPASFQPSELVKLVIVFYLAHIFSRKEGREEDDWTGTIVPPAVMTALSVLFVYAQNDFSTAVFVLFLGLCMFWIARVKIRYIISLIVVPLPIGLIMMFTQEHRVERIITFLRPKHDAQGISYQVNASLEALIQGGFWGKGIGMGTKKLGGIPEVQSDFVFAAFGEEVGFLGVVAVLAIVCLLSWRGYQAALASKTSFEYYLGFGLSTLFLYQVLANMAVVSGLVPATGMPMPFFSAGGSSLLATGVLCGFLLNISRRAPRESEASYV
jgi:cell division protein FtsW